MRNILHLHYATKINRQKFQSNSRVGTKDALQAEIKTFNRYLYVDIFICEY